MNIKKAIKDARGAALVYVIVAAAIIILLGAATTATAYVNLRATQVQEQSDNNFYSADTIMNAIVGGLESDISIAYEKAYTKVITNINSYSSASAAEEDFDTLFVESLAELLNDGEEFMASFYKIKHIQGYVQDIYEDDVRYTISAVNGNNYLDATDEGVVLRNLHVTYEDDSGYYDEIITDVKIAIPELNLELIDEDGWDFESIVIDDGLEINEQRGLQITGDTYINEREADKSAILLNNSTLLSITTPKELIAGGYIDLAGEVTELILQGTADKKEKNMIWTENISVYRYADLYISGQTFVQDDLEVNGSHSTVVLSGDYYGYSRSHEKADESSAVNINGADTKMDLSKLKMFVLGGSSYVSTSTLPSGSNAHTNSSDLQLGESLSVKSNQVAYLVDDREFIGSPNVVNFVSNPMSYIQYQALVDANGGPDQTMTKIVNQTLSYGKTYKQYGATAMPVFSSKDGGTVYIYLKFDNASKAAAYFTEAYAGDSLLSQRLRTYAAQYITELKVDKDATNLIIGENYIDASVGLYTKENLPIVNNFQGLGYSKDNTENENWSEDDLNAYLDASYNKYLISGEFANVGEKYKRMYADIVDEEMMRTFITTASSAFSDHHTEDQIHLIDNGVILDGTSGSQAIIVDNDGKEPYRLETGKGLVVCSGDLEIAGDWLGAIIVGGRAYCVEGSTLTPVDLTVDKMVVREVTPLYYSWITGETKHSLSVINIFEGYQNVGSNNATANHGVNADTISNCLTFTNWNRY